MLRSPAQRESSHDDRSVAQRLLAVFLLGVLAFGYPLLAIFNVAASIGGIPVLYAYMFAAWLVLIVLVALIVRSD